MLVEIISNALEITTSGYKKIIYLDNELRAYVKRIVGIDLPDIPV